MNIISIPYIHIVLLISTSLVKFIGEVLFIRLIPIKKNRHLLDKIPLKAILVKSKAEIKALLLFHGVGGAAAIVVRRVRRGGPLLLLLLSTQPPAALRCSADAAFLVSADWRWRSTSLYNK